MNVTDEVFARRRNTRLRSSLGQKASGRRTLSKRITQVVVGAAAFVFVALGGADGALRAGADSALAHFNRHNEVVNQRAAAPHEASATALTWTIDVNGDGVADFSNPTHGAVRGVDAFGSGRFGAVRDDGKRRHHGVDYVAAPGAAVLAPLSGKVTRIGFAYGDRDALRYVEIVNPETHLTARVLYLAPNVAEGDLVSAGDAIGVAQDLTGRYPGITNHVHVDLRDAQRRWLDASEQLPSAPLRHAHRKTSATAS